MVLADRPASPALELNDDDRTILELENSLLSTTDMAVVVSQGQNELSDMAKLGLDIRPHRQRMNEENLEKRFKDAADPLGLVFVCAMWTTGFDVPSCSTIYLDKPMRNHTLMQTIARANRVFPLKTCGLIVDYAGVFVRLQEALAIYAKPRAGTAGSGDDGSRPVEAKDELVEWLRTAMKRSRSAMQKFRRGPRRLDRSGRL